MPTLLITRPEHDEVTNCLSKWSEKIIDTADKKGINVIDLHREKANRKRVVGTLEKGVAKLVVLNGHGSDSSVHGHDNELILKEGDGDAVKDKIIYARSCKSAKKLGQDTIDHGAIAYLGYEEDFVIVTDKTVSKPLQDKTAELFLEPSNYIPISLIKGHTAGDADKRSKNLFRKNINKLVVAGPASDNYEDIIWLLWDMKHQVCIGDTEAVFA